MAGAALAALPVIVLFVLFRRYLVGALLTGALKQ
jgi:ABC-type maltose transport system permease subunit